MNTQHWINITQELNDSLRPLCSKGKICQSMYKNVLWAKRLYINFFQAATVYVTNLIILQSYTNRIVSTLFQYICFVWREKVVTDLWCDKLKLVKKKWHQKSESRSSKNLDNLSSTICDRIPLLPLKIENSLPLSDVSQIQYSFLQIRRDIHCNHTQQQIKNHLIHTFIQSPPMVLLCFTFSNCTNLHYSEVLSHSICKPSDITQFWYQTNQSKFHTLK